MDGLRNWLLLLLKSLKPPYWKMGQNAQRRDFLGGWIGWTFRTPSSFQLVICEIGSSRLPLLVKRWRQCWPIPCPLRCIAKLGFEVWRVTEPSRKKRGHTGIEWAYPKDIMKDDRIFKATMEIYWQNPKAWLVFLRWIHTWWSLPQYVG